MTRLLERTAHSAGVALYHAGLANAIIGLTRHWLRVVEYHGCSADETDFARHFHTNVKPAHLDAQLDYIARHYHVIPLDELHAAGRGECPLPDRALVITFDDGARSVYDEAFPRLRARGLPATVYLVTNAVGNETLIWNDELSYLLENFGAAARPLLASWVGLSASATAEALLGAARDEWNRRDIAHHLDELRRVLGTDAGEIARAHALYLDWPEIETMAASQFTFGNHTAAHARLSGLREPEQCAAMSNAAAELDGRPGTIASLAYPFGAFDEHSRAAARAVGFESVMQVGGVNRRLRLDAVARVPLRDGGAADAFADLEVVAPLKHLARWMLSLRPRVRRQSRRQSRA